MEDVKAQAGVPSQTEVITGETATPSSVPPQTDQTTVESKPTAVPIKSTVPDRSIPYPRFAEVNKKMREYQKELATLRGRSQLEAYDPAETERVMQHPLVQKLLIDNAKSQVTDFAKGYLEQFPSFPSVVKKAILKNVRGFINEETTDPETAKEDVRQYIDDVWAEQEASQAPANLPGQVTPATVPVVSPTNIGNAPGSEAVKPKDIQEILGKPLTEWTDEDTAKVESYSQTLKK